MKIEKNEILNFLEQIPKSNLIFIISYTYNIIEVEGRKILLLVSIIFFFSKLRWWNLYPVSDSQLLAWWFICVAHLAKIDPYKG